MFTSLRGRITVTFILLAIIPLVIIGLVLAQQSFAAQQKEAIYAEQQVVRRAAGDIESFIRVRESELQQVADISSLNSGEELDTGIFNLLLSRNVYDRIIVTNATGQSIHDISRFSIGGTGESLNLANEEVFTFPVESGSTYYGPVRFNEDTNEPTMTIAIPLIDVRTGGVTGVLIAEFRFRTVWNLIADLNINTETLVYVVNRENNIIAHRNPSVVLQNTSFIVPEGDGTHQGLSNETVLMVSYDLEFGSQTFTVVSEVPIQVALALAFNTVYTTLGVIIVTLVSAGILGFVVARRLTNPIEELVQVATAISGGDLSQRARVASTDEIGVLAQSFNDMTTQLASLIGNLEQRVKERTRDLDIAAQVSQQVTRVLELDQLLPYLAELTVDGFNMAHVSVFVYDRVTGVLQLEASSGAIGREMLATGKQFHINDKGLVPLAARSSEAQIINDVAQSADHFVNPLLPDTRSEMAIPMRVGTQLIGILDLQSNEVDRFTGEQVNILTALADQIAIAVRNAELFEAAEIARAGAEQANVVKSQFLSSMSHELRTPLNAILNFTQFVSTGMLGEINSDQVEMLDKVVYSGKHLLSLINDVLDISKIEAGALKLFVEDDVDMAKEIETILATAEGLLAEKPVKLRSSVAADLPLIVGDKRRLRQVMLNLTSNACKFTDEGEVEITLKKAGDVVQFSLRDTGQGIAPEDFELIFETFRQTKSGLRQGEGTGLGLPISRRLVEAHGGHMWLESVVDEGSTFHFTIPVSNPELRPMVKRKEVKHAV